MKHLVQYHNVATQGPLAAPSSSSGQRPADDYYQVGTNKHFRDLRGSFVWCVSGQGAPRSYQLAYVFIVDEVVVDGSGDELSVGVRGRHGHSFRPRPDLTDLPWFKLFRRSQGNFAFGLSTIRDEFVPRLQSLLPRGSRFR